MPKIIEIGKYLFKLQLKMSGVFFETHSRLSSYTSQRIIHHITIVKVSINYALPLKAAQRDAITKLKSFWGFRSELQTKANAVSFRFAVSATLMLSVCDRLGTKQIIEGAKKTPVLFSAVCGPKFMKFRDNVEDLSYFPMSLTDCLFVFRSEDIRH